MTLHQRSFWDAVMFGFTASVTLWPDLAPAEVAIVLTVLLGAALLELATQPSDGTEQISGQGARS